jgi:hypothetical protein
VQAALPLNVGDARPLRGDETILEAELFAQPDAFRFLYEQRVGASVDGEAVDLLAQDDAAGAAAGFEECEGDATAEQLVSDRKARDAPANDDDLGSVVSQLYLPIIDAFGPDPPAWR